MRRRRPGARSCRRAGCSPAACSSSTPPRAASSTTRDQGDARRRAPVRRVAASRASCTSTTCPTASTSCHSHESVLRRQETFGYTHEELKLLVAPMATHRRRGARLDGHRHADRGAVRPPAPAVRLLPAAVRAGHQPAARRHPRGARHLAVGAPSAPRATCSSPARESCRQIELPFPIIDNDELAKLIHIDDDGDRPEFAAARDLGPLPRRRRRRRRCARRSTASAPRRRPAIAEGKRIIVLSDRDSDAELRADPVAAAHLGGAPPPDPREDPHPGRASSSRPATPARCTTWRCSSATAPARSTRTSRSSRSRTSSPQGLHGLGGHGPAQGGQELHQGRAARACSR